jgi:hypothetical protein
VVFIAVGDAIESLLRGTMRIVPRTDASSGAAYILVSVLEMADVFGKGDGDGAGVAVPVEAGVACVELF